jgi:hypothetical protein
VYSGKVLIAMNWSFAGENFLQVAKTYLIDKLKTKIKPNTNLALKRLIFLLEHKLNWIQFIKIGFKLKIPYAFFSSLMNPVTESCICFWGFKPKLRHAGLD